MNLRQRKIMYRNFYVINKLIHCERDILQIIGLHCSFNTDKDKTIYNVVTESQLTSSTVDYA